MAGERTDLLVKNGLLVTGEGISRADVAIGDGKVTQVGADLSHLQAGREIDATGKYVLPGAIDAHCHPVYSDKMDTMSVCAAFGGITTLIPFIGNVSAWGYGGIPTLDSVKRFIEDAERESMLDFAVHGVFTPADIEAIPKAVPALIRMGVTSFKMFMAYSRRGMMMPDEAILQVMDLAASDGGLVQIHAETGCCIDYLIDQYTAAGDTGPAAFLPSQPNILEVEALNRAATFAAVTGCPLYPVHLSAAEVSPVLRHFREMDKAPLFGETCPQYLALTNDLVLEKAYLGKCGPPLRTEADNDAMWRAVADGTINTIASDSSGLSRSMKASGGMTREAPGSTTQDEDAPINIFQGSYGLNTIEFMVPVVWSRGVNAGRITLPRLVQVLCENPAKIFGIYPQKGALQVGSDADLVLWDPAKKHTVTEQHGNADFTSFEGFELLGMPVLVMQRGEMVIEDGKVARQRGRARFLASDVNSAAYASNGHEVG